MQTQQQLHQPMGDEFVQRQQFLVRFVYCVTVFTGSDARAGFQRICRLAHHRILQRFTGDNPQRDETIDSGWKTQSENAPVTRGSVWFEIEIKGTLESVRSQKHERIQPLKWIHETHTDIDVMF